ncbi:MAG TPA: septal ring lytic transglycosylase RlpA family protein [Stellaceae bacterium]
MAESPEKSSAEQASAFYKAEPVNSAKRSGRGRAVHRSAAFRWPARFAFHRGGRSHYDYRDSGADGDDGSSGWDGTQTTGYEQIGQATWYDLVGNRTSSGERLDTETPTAAHRTLPLGSCAKVISLDTGRSVIVRINDRGPYTRRSIIDLSPRAAAELGMIHAGTAAVAVEPVAASPTNVAVAPTSAVYQAAGSNLPQ